MVREIIIAGLAGLMIDAAGCASHHRSAPVPPPEPVEVTVNNSNYLDVDVFAVRGTSRARLGSVTGLSTATFLVPVHLAADGNLQLLVDPIGSNATYLTDKIAVGPGQHVELTVTAILRMSSYSVWSK
ncbi:MAG TPA: hypothetical protein VFW03_21465 [Gemmatimonadaceae bacterium]|nr:hypothetical protein [Gemmatimonadaceae bacterium]